MPVVLWILALLLLQAICEAPWFGAVLLAAFVALVGGWIGVEKWWERRKRGRSPSP